jgi:hypothetical protein
MRPLPFRLRVINRGDEYDKLWEFQANADHYIRTACVGKNHGFKFAYLYETVDSVEHYRGEYDKNGVFTPVK